MESGELDWLKRTVCPTRYYCKDDILPPLPTVAISRSDLRWSQEDDEQREKKDCRVAVPLELEDLRILRQEIQSKHFQPGS